MGKILCMLMVVVLSLTPIITLPVAASDIGLSFISNLKYLGPTTDGTTAFDGTPVLMDDLQNGKTIYTNYSVIHFANINDFMVGLPYIKIPNPIAGLNPSFVKTAWSGEMIDWVSFDLNKSAIIRVFTQGEINTLSTHGFLLNAAPVTPGYYFQRYNDISNEYDSMNYMYTKEVSVPEGGTVTITLPNAPGLTCWGYSIVIDTTYSDSGFAASSVSFTDGTNAITSVVPNSTIKATTQVQNNGFSGTVTFVLAEYTGNRCTKVNVDTKEVANRKTELFQARITVGNDVSNVCYKAFIWQSGRINPIINLATFPSNNIQLESICIDGAELEGFSNSKTEYTYRAYSLGVNDNACPTVTAEVADNSTKIEVINPTTLPGAITVKVISSVGTIKTFTINCEVYPAITNLKYLGPTTDGTTTFDGTPVLMDNLQNGNAIYTTYSDVLFANISNDLVGLPYIKISNPIAGLNPSFVKTAWSGGTTIDWVSFDLSKSALIKVFTQVEMNTLSTYGFSLNLPPETPGYYFQRYNNITNEYESMNYLYTKEVSVPEGETVTVTLPNAPGLTWGWGYSIVACATKKTHNDTQITHRSINDLFYDDFSSDPEGAVPNGYQIAYNGCTVEVEKIDVGNNIKKNCLKLLDTKNSSETEYVGPSVIKTFEKQKSVFAIEYRSKIVKTKTNVCPLEFLVRSGTSNAFRVLIDSGNGLMWYNNEDTIHVLVLDGKVPFDTWYTVRAVVDVINKRADVMVTLETLNDKASVNIVTDLKFNGNFSSDYIDNARIGMSRLEGINYFDYIKVEKNANRLQPLKLPDIQAPIVPDPQPHPVKGIININYNDEYMFFPKKPRVINEIIMVPVLNFFDMLNLKVKQDDDGQTITGSKDGLIIVIKAGSNEATVNGEKIILNAESVKIDGKVFIPLRSVLEIMGIKVEWNDEMQTAFITDKE